MTRSGEHGRRAGLVSAVGVETGTLIHIALAVLGVGAFIASSPMAFTIVKYAGVAYLAYLGVRALRSQHREQQGPTPAMPLGKAFVEGAVVNLLNPKVVLFFLAFLPQFVSDPSNARSEMLLLGAVFFGLALTMDLLYAVAGSAMNSALHHRPSALRRQHVVVAGIYLSLGAYAAVV